MAYQINFVHMRQDLEILEAAIERLQKRIDNTLAQYGTGVRPAWVSADIAIDQANIDRRMERAARLRRQIEKMTEEQKKKRPPLQPL